MALRLSGQYPKFSLYVFAVYVLVTQPVKVSGWVFLFSGALYVRPYLTFA